LVIALGRTIVEFDDFTFAYAGSPTPAVQHITFSVEEGEIAVLAGLSGSGKSTILKAINGLIPHIYPGEYSGAVRVDGLTVRDTPTYQLAKKVGFLFQNPENQIFMFTVERDIAFGLENMGYDPKVIREKTDWAMDLLNIRDLAKRSPSELSDGQKQRVAIAGSLVMDPKILVLDEPTSLLDPKTALDVVNLAKTLNRELGLTVILVEHRLELVSTIASKMIVVKDGSILLQGDPYEVLFSDGLEDAGLSLPPIVELQKKLGTKVGKPALDVEEFVKEVPKVWHS
jgi:energy-coupling factor transport system ATP-binding protein